MKLSTKIKKHVHPIMLWNPNGKCTYAPMQSGHFYGDDEIDRTIIFIIDHKRDLRGKRFETFSLSEADRIHEYLTKECGCTLLPLNECPVVNDREIVMHYTTTTYAKWCNM